jgi:dihydroorotate dehydrogenase
MYKFIIRPILFLFDPEKIHNFTFFCLRLASSVPGIPYLVKKSFQLKHPSLERELFGIKFPNPVGLAAGLDKNAEAFDMLGFLGFGFVEIGTLTPVGQPGNPKPRAFRLKKDKALINRMGFNNLGVEEAVKRLKKKKSTVIIGGNIGKNKITSNENAIYDYLNAFNTLFPYVDYFAVNISSPNTPNLRELQDKEPLKNLLGTLMAANQKKGQPKPILLKIAPDLSNEQLDDIIEIIKSTGTNGIIATNTTIERKGLCYPSSYIENIGTGGLSGKPLKDRSTAIIKYIVEKSNSTIPIIGVGGIMDADDASEKIKAGASLIQLYTGFIYEGPALIRKINRRILKSEEGIKKSAI